MPVTNRSRSGSGSGSEGFELNKLQAFVPFRSRESGRVCTLLYVIEMAAAPPIRRGRSGLLVIHGFTSILIIDSLVTPPSRVSGWRAKRPASQCDSCL
jgi:hypothetical protein